MEAIAEKKKAITLECVGECVLVRRLDKDDELSEGGIVKPQTARQKSTRGEVAAIGEGRMIGGHFLPFSFSVGDVVHFTKYGGTEVELNGETLLKFHWKQIIGVEKWDDQPSV